ncbi:MAG TPA: hypothetical protein RMG48_03990 [Myxococcales bacterium LLY-WYZ-16_1]|jgi:hypothetical protein|nr:hypothetical protein [Myxococcales bacterium LLY-WYZ-16_1]
MATQFAKAYEDVGEASRQVQAYQNSQAKSAEPKLAGIYGDRPTQANNNELVQQILKSSKEERRNIAKAAAARIRRRPARNEASMLWARNSPPGTFAVKTKFERERERGFGFIPAQVGGNPQGGYYTAEHGAVITFEEGDHGVSAAFSPSDNMKRTSTPKEMRDQIYARMTEARYKRMNEDRVPLYTLANRPLMIAA